MLGSRWDLESVTNLFLVSPTYKTETVTWPSLAPVGCWKGLNEHIDLHLGLDEARHTAGAQKRAPLPQALRGWAAFPLARWLPPWTWPALNSDPTGQPQKASCEACTRTASHSPYRGDSTLSVYTGGHLGLGEVSPGSAAPGGWFLVPQGQAPSTTSEARFPEISLPLASVVAPPPLPSGWRPGGLSLGPFRNRMGNV